VERIIIVVLVVCCVLCGANLSFVDLSFFSSFEKNCFSLLFRVHNWKWWELASSQLTLAGATGYAKSCEKKKDAPSTGTGIPVSSCYPQ
jgi:hypothetical protein